MPDTLIAVIIAGRSPAWSGGGDGGGVVKILIPGTMAPSFAPWKPVN